MEGTDRVWGEKKQKDRKENLARNLGGKIRRNNKSKEPKIREGEIWGKEKKEIAQGKRDPLIFKIRGNGNVLRGATKKKPGGSRN